MADPVNPGFEMAGLDSSGSAAASAAPSAYRVLARKYRPASFLDLIGQEAMVRTISNAFETGRIPQAWILTGVRGVGKTTTARILARALNYELPDGSAKGPTIHMPSEGLHCRAIMESRHIDVLEMDAASHTGIDDVRQITDGVRYAPSSARYKVYIIDEVHMLSEKAFNAFLKTLEEPPPHAKFIFATTEIRKVPITVLSRCQRFDLRRIETATLIGHLGKLAHAESIEVEPEALALIARAAEGSVRDSLSLFDQAIAHAGAKSGIAGLGRAGAARAGAGVLVRADDVRQMLGLADRTRIIDLFEQIARGDIEAAFAEFRNQYDTGADPVVVLSDLAEFVNFVTRIKVAPALADDVALSESERTRGKDFAAKLSVRALSRMWQMLLKGINEVQGATRPAAAAEMILVRIAYAADLPTPDEALRALAGNLTGNGASAPAGGGVSSGGGASSRPARLSESALHAPTMAQAHVSTPAHPAPASVQASAMPTQSPSAARRFASGEISQSIASPTPALPMAGDESGTSKATLRLNHFSDVVALAAERRDIQIKLALENDIRLVDFEDGRIEINTLPNAPRMLVPDLQRKLTEWTGRRWVVVVSTKPGGATLREKQQASEQTLKDTMRADPRIQSVLERFPGAEIVDIRKRDDDFNVADSTSHAPPHDMIDESDDRNDV